MKNECYEYEILHECECDLRDIDIDDARDTLSENLSQKSCDGWELVGQVQFSGRGYMATIRKRND